MQFWALLIDSLRESRDRKIFWLLIVASAVVALAMLSIGFEPDRVTFFFGLADTSTSDFNPMTILGRQRIVGVVIYWLLSTLVGWIGMTLTLIATAGFFPTFLERGCIDVVLAKPIGRARLFLFKYMAGMVFVLIQSMVFVGLTFLVMGLRWGVWKPGYLLCIPLLVLLFSYVYCISVLVAVRTRSTLAAILISLAVWAVGAMVHQSPMIFEQFPTLKEKQPALHRTLKVLSWIPPKTGDVTYLAARWSGAGLSLDAMPSGTQPDLSREDAEVIESSRKAEENWLQVNAAQSIGSSLIFEAVLVLLAMWSFRRQDF